MYMKMPWLKAIQSFNELRHPDALEILGAILVC